MTWGNNLRGSALGLTLFSGGYALHAEAIVHARGRVPAARDLDELHDSMKSDVGLSLRILENQDVPLRPGLVRGRSRGLADVRASVLRG